MNVRTFATRAAAVRFAAAVDKAEGYPKDGVNVGGGRHVAAAKSRTVRHDRVRVHAARKLWAYPVSAAVGEHEGARVTVEGKLVTITAAGVNVEVMGEKDGWT